MGTTSNVSYRPKIFIHAPYQPAPNQAIVKKYVLDAIRKLGFEPQEFHVSGIAKGDPWSASRAIEVMHQCDGALILALMRWENSTGSMREPIPSEYSHYEGALALACSLPTIVFAEEGMQERGVLSSSGGSFVLRVPMQNLAQWMVNNEILASPPFETWVSRVRERYDVFFGYCSKADAVAKNMKDFLINEAGMRVLDWATDFRPGRTIMEEVARATATCRCGLFLFTADDPVEGSASKTAVPRDNVLLEAGYFMSAHSAKRMVVVREKGTKMPVDLGGMIYLTLERRNQWKNVARKVADSLYKQMNESE
jgi:hypothetical protein